MRCLDWQTYTHSCHYAELRHARQACLSVPFKGCILQHTAFSLLQPLWGAEIGLCTVAVLQQHKPSMTFSST